MSVRIVVDSTADLNVSVKNRITIVPLTIHFGKEEFVDGITISHEEFYTKLIKSPILPTTSQATPASFEAVFDEVVRAGDTAVVITVSSKLSGTCQSAMIAAMEYPEQIFIVDSETVAIGAGILAEYALQLADSGMAASQIANIITKEKENVNVIALLDTLEYLKKGGRISKTVAFAGGVLNIKPVACIKAGEILLLGKARGAKQGNNLLVTEIQKVGGVDFSRPILLGYTGNDDTLLQNYIENSTTLWADAADSLPISQIGSVVGTHAGPGAIAAAFFSKSANQ